MFALSLNNLKPKKMKKLTAAENKQALLHPERIKKITQHILSTFKQKTHRLTINGKGFNAMFAVSSVDLAKYYYEAFKTVPERCSEAPQGSNYFFICCQWTAECDWWFEDESFEVTAMNSSAKEFLQSAIDDYNAMFKTNFGLDSKEFQNYYRDLAKRVKGRDGQNKELPESRKSWFINCRRYVFNGLWCPNFKYLICR